MKKILVAGLINIETSVAVSAFPVEYTPIEFTFFNINSHVSGVGNNVTQALHALSDQVFLASFIGQDDHGKTITREFEEAGLQCQLMIPSLNQTPSSVILYDEQGRRKIYCDLKDIQEQVYPIDRIEPMVPNLDGVVICNINFNQTLIEQCSRWNIPIFTDVHVLSQINDTYNKRFLMHADVVFLSDEQIVGNHEDFLIELYRAYYNKIIVLGQGKLGALMLDASARKVYAINSVETRKVVNTCGAGDALFSCFVHYYVRQKPAIECLKRAVTFASYKIGESGGSCGFMNEETLEKWCSVLSYRIRVIKEF